MELKQEIILEPDEVWDYCSRKGVSLAYADEIIAYGINEGTQVKIVIGSDPYVDEGWMYGYTDFSYYIVYVQSDDGTVLSEFEITSENCEDVVDYLYDSYGCKNEEEEEVEIEEIIEDRETTIDEAFDDFISILADTVNVPIIEDNLRTEVKENILSYLADSAKIEIYRPMYIEKEGGVVECVDFPYGLID